MKELQEKYNSINNLNTVSNKKKVLDTPRGATKQKPTKKHKETRNHPKKIIRCIHDHENYSGGYKEETYEGYCKV